MASIVINPEMYENIKRNQTTRELKHTDKELELIKDANARIKYYSLIQAKGIAKAQNILFSSNKHSLVLKKK